MQIFYWVRGGSFWGVPRVRPALRNWDVPGESWVDLGFRCVCVCSNDNNNNKKEGTMNKEDFKFIPAGDHGFEAMECPVTVGQWNKFAEATGRARMEEDENLPVVNVSKIDADAFCAWLSVELGVEVSLPTNEQWSILAGYPERVYPWGNEDPTPELAVYGRSARAPVGSCPKGAGPFGHLDLAGNVWEWTCTEVE